VELTAGTLWRMRRIADDGGFLTMLATDQRPPIERLVAAKRGETDPRHGDVAAVKRALISELGAHASAVLVDPLVGYPAAVDTLDPRRGLLVTLEHAVYEETAGGRRSGPIPHWSVEAIARLGADAVKVLAWYRPDAAGEVRLHQQQWVADVAAECRRHDLPFLFELLVYPFAVREGIGDSYAEDPGKRVEAVIESVETFADPRFGVDVFKLESPIPAGDLPDPDADDGHVQRVFDTLGRAAGRPWVVLSAGADSAAFRRVVMYACRAGASGFLAGRAIWWQALQRFPDMDAFTTELGTHSVPYLDSLTELVGREAAPWHRHPRFGSNDLVPAAAGPDWAHHYAHGS
jgi:tagatose 1,6-diphosphate aldolase